MEERIFYKKDEMKQRRLKRKIKRNQNIVKAKSFKNKFDKEARKPEFKMKKG
jgi:hypothetical protein